MLPYPYKRSNKMKQMFSTRQNPAVTELKRAIAASFGGLLYCVGVNLFIVPIGLYNGGIMGYCQIIRTLLADYLGFAPPFDIAGILYFIVNIPIMIFAWIKLDKKFVLRGLVNIAIVTIFLSVIPVKQVLSGEIIANCLVGGVLTGIGTGISLWAATPGGGTDLIGLMMIKRDRRFSVGRLNLVIDVILYLLCIIFFNVQTAIYSIVYSVINTIVIDRLHMQNINVQAMIITDKPADELKNALIHELDRGITELPAKGGYSGKAKEAILVVVSKYEVNELTNIIARYDEHAFVTYTENAKIFGNFVKKL